MTDRLELEIENGILKHLSRSKDILIFKFPRGQPSHSRKNTVNRSGSGVADLICNVKLDQIMITVYLEVKRKTGRLRDSQYKFSQDIATLNGHYYVVRSEKEAIDAVEDAKNKVRAIINNEGSNEGS